MEKKLFKFGRSSYAIVLPKSWVSKSGLSKSGQVFMNEDENGNIVLGTKRTGTTEFEEVVSKETYTFLWRLIGFHYMYGTTRLRVYSKDGFTSRQIGAVEDNVRRYYMGYEITSQSANDLVIEDVMNIKDMSMDKILAKISFLVKEEFKDLLGGNYGKSMMLPKKEILTDELFARQSARAGKIKAGGKYTTIDSMEELVNRFYLLGIRYLNIVKPGNTYLYLRPLQLMEDSGDQISRLSTMNVEKAHAVIGDIATLFNDSVEAMTGKREKIDAVFQLTEAIMKKMEKLKEERHLYEVLYDLTWDIAVIAEAGLIREKLGEKTGLETS
ncbi:MAG: AbrB/MazE/SpoVT family DNA-binding domain-containing protein [Candidatus Micrarchaeota archaeon]|nr:AbrB/MazE/SpoVT family DNA-binding domain-containing protein [Candidatus Micrarchaeota archaeon]